MAEYPQQSGVSLNHTKFRLTYWETTWRVWHIAGNYKFKVSTTANNSCHFYPLHSEPQMFLYPLPDVIIPSGVTVTK